MKIKFENKKEISYLKKIYNEEYVLDMFDILKTLSKKNNIENPIINVVDYSYDYKVLTFKVKDKNKTNNLFLVSFHVDLKKVFVRYPNKCNYDYYTNTFGYEIVLDKEGYISADNNKRVEKIHFSSPEMIKANSQVLNRYTYNYYIDNYKYVIKLSLPKNVIFNESYFLNALLLNENTTKDIIDLYNIIKSFLRTDKFSINIENQDTKEHLTIKNGIILEVVKNIQNENLDYTINYQKNGDKEKLEIINKVLEPEKNIDMQKIKRKIR